VDDVDALAPQAGNEAAERNYVQPTPPVEREVRNPGGEDAVE
jgi:hypothetical protein